MSTRINDLSSSCITLPNWSYNNLRNNAFHLVTRLGVASSLPSNISWPSFSSQLIRFHLLFILLWPSGPLSDRTVRICGSQDILEKKVALLLRFSHKSVIWVTVLSDVCSILQSGSGGGSGDESAESETGKVHGKGRKQKVDDQSTKEMKSEVRLNTDEITLKKKIIKMSN